MSYSAIQFVKPNPLQGMAALEKAIALPHEYPATRYPSFPALERTAVMGFNLPRQLSFPTGATEMKGILFRQACWPLWVQQSIAQYAQQVKYPCRDVNRATPLVGENAGTTWVPMDCWDTPSYVSNSNVIASLNSVGMSGIVSPPWVYPLFGNFGDKIYTYVPAGATLSFVVTSAIHSTSSNIQIGIDYEIWRGADSNDGRETTAGQLVMTGTNLGAFINMGVQPVNHWIRPVNIRYTSDVITQFGEVSVAVLVSSGTPTYVPSTSTFGTVSFTTSPSTLLVPLAGPPEFDVTERPWMDTRTTASAVLLTNVTKVLNKEGTVLAGRLLNRHTEAWNFDSARLSQLHPAEKAMLPLETGFYTYAPPSTDMATFFDYTMTLTGDYAEINSTERYPVFRLDNTAYANCFILADSDAATPSSFAVNTDWHIEFRNNSTLFQIGMSAITLEAFHQAILNLVSHGFFFSNGKHKGLISKIIAGGQKAAPYLTPLLPPSAAMAARAGLKAAGVAQKLLSRRPNTTPPTTSAKASGMMPESKGKKGKAQKGKGKKGRH